MVAQEALYTEVCRHMREASYLSSILELLEWDERTKMPAAGAEFRAEQTAYLAGLVHQKKVDPKLGEWLEELGGSELAADPHSAAGANIRLIKRDFDRQTRLPQRLVEELAKAAVQGQQQWALARRANDFGAFRPQLERMVQLKKEEAAAIGFAATPYDALLDDYEPGETTANVANILGDLRCALVPLVQAIAESPIGPDTAILQREFPMAKQEAFGKLAAAQLGFDFGAGRLDTTDHPFCAGLGPRDVRLTTRYDEHWFSDAFYSILHEAGHGIYDQGLPSDSFGLPTGEYVSLGVHESQSRMWENQVGRSRAFWEFFFPQAQQAFAPVLDDSSAEQFYRAVNVVKPSLIRVEADEVTYNIHVLIRFELEKALLEDELAVADLPGAWQEKYQHYLGIVSPTDADGVLQDVHWGAGLFGYFPTYSLGNLYAAQFFDQAKHDLGDLLEQFRKGQFSPLREWLREKIHCHGRNYSAGELALRVTGKPLSHDSLITQLSTKYGELYAL